MRIKTQQNLVVLGFAQQIQAVSQRTKQIATTILKITGIFAWVFMAYGLQAQSLSTDDFSGTYCLEASFNVNYTASGDFGSNTFKAYVSKDNFVTSVEIGSKSVSGTQSNGSISVTIPGNLSSANNYRIRVVSTSAPILGDSDDNGTNLTITALTITANNPSASIYCVGDPISVDFTTSCALSNGNTFTLQLSDKTGSFASPTTVATKTGTTGSTITGNIPNVPYGSAYKVRVVSSNPNTNTTWTANTTAFKIGNAKLSNLKSVGSTFCPGEVMSLGYTFASNEELNPGNITSVQLSDASGSFASPTVLGSLGSTATSGTIYAIIPYVVTGGSGYRIRIVSSNTATVGCIEYGPYTITKVRDFTDPISSYVCAGGTLNLSTDAGFTSYAWQKVSAPPFSNINVGSTSTTSLAKNGSNVYIGTARGLYVSSDGGSTFSKNSQVIDTFINKIFVNGAKVYAATANGIYYSSDSGANFNTNFTSDNNGLPLQNVSAVATNADGTIIYAGTTSGLSRSTNSGTSFAAVSIGQSVSDTITVSGIFVSGSTVYLSTGAGLKISYDDGATFPVSIGSGTGLLPSANATSVFVKDGIIYVGTDSGLSVSTNGGGSWTNYNAINNGLAGDMVNAIAVANNLIYLCTNNGLSVGNLGGDGFSIISISQTFTNINGIVAEATSSTVNSLYLVIVGGGFVTNTFTLSDLGVSTSSYAQSVVSSDSGSSFQVKVEKNGCFLTSNQAHIADIPPDFSSVTSVAPTQCGGVSGRIILSGLAPNAQYQLFYTGPSQGIPKSGDTVTITAQGTDTIFLLGPGTYTNIYMKSLVKRTGQTDGCTNTAASIVISDGIQPTAVTANTLSPICSGQNLSISLTSTLAANEVYRWYTDAGGTILASPDITTGNTFTLTNLPTSSGTLYVRKRNNNTQCTGNLLAINYTVNKAVQISSSVASQPSSATATDGSLIIAITSSNNLSGAYTLSYNKVVNSVSTPQTVSGLTLASFPYTLSNLSVGNYTNITVTANNGCPSNVIASTALVGLPSPTAIGGATLQSQNCGIVGVDGGYFQKVELPYAASSNWITENAGAIAVGRIRQSIYNSAAKNETIEMRGYVKFDLSSIPTNATIDKVELRPRSLFGGFQTVGDVTISYAVGDLKFDVTQVSATNYSPYVGYSDQVFDDLFDPKYNDFVIGANATGALTDLGAQAVNDVQLRLANDKKFELGIALSGTDTILPLTLFNGIVFAPSSYQKLCITYHLNDYGDLPEPKYATNAEGGLVGPSHRVDLLDVNPDVNTTLLRPALYIGATAPDAEADGQVNDNASGTADEDLTTASFSGKLIAGESVTLTVPVTNNIPQPAKLSVFIDWNGDGIFNNTSERYDQDVLPATQVSASSTPIPYTNSFAFNLTVPKLDNSYAVGVRVRLSTGTGLDAYGPAPNGEVEDFLMDVLGLDYGDLPDPTAGLGIDNYQTRRADNGARHAVPTTLLVFLGNTVDTETDAVPSALADGDDKNNINNNDEDGIRFLTSPMVPGQPVTIEYTATNNSSTAAKLYLYADFNNDGVNSMEDTPVVFTSGNAVVAANAGQVTRQLTFLLPQNAVYGGEKAMFRFRFTTDVDPLPHGLAQDGEVEDYLSSDFQLTDWADLPEPRYITDATGGIQGPSHRIRYIDVDPTSGLNYQNTLYIGATPPDAEKDGKPSHLATGDDSSYQDDEDLSYLNFLNPGTNLPFPLVADEPIRLRIPVVNNSPDNPATLWAFMDWNGDGDFEDEGEKMSKSVDADYSGNIDFDFTIPKVSKSDTIGIRIRLTSGSIIDAYGPAPDGEVEDFVVEIRTIDYGDLPDATAGLGIDNYQTRRLDNGARHAVPVVPLVYLGSTVDAEKDGVPSALADGDDKNNINADDEDGIRFLTSPMVPGQPVTIEYTATNNSSAAAKLYLYADFNNDGVNSIENVSVVFTSGDAVVAANAGTVTRQLTFTLPQNAEYGGDKAMFRFRFTTDINPLPYGLAQDGEIEDYLSSDFLLNDWADLPEPKYITDATGGIVGPSHRIHYLDVDPSAGENYLNTLYIGATPPDSERDGQPTHLANGDNNSYQADEDLSYLNFLNPTTNQPFPLVADEPIRLRIPVVNNSASKPATLWAFMDWNGDGDFEDEGEKMSQAVATNYSGNIDFDFTIPKVSKSDSIGIRIRLTTGVGIDAYGPAPDGEVEDFVVEIRTIDYGDLPDATAGLGIDNYQTRRLDNGARHAVPVVPLVYLGSTVDAEKDGVPSALADGDDKNTINANDEDGIRFLTSPMVPGQPVTIEYTATNNSSAAAKLYLYADFNNDGVNSIENVPVVFISGDAVVAANAGTVTQQLTFILPQNAEYGGDKAMFRFRFTTDVDPLPYGLAQDGEIEDYLSSDFLLNDWADLPEPKYITDATGGIVGPSHRIHYLDIDPSAGENYLNTLYIGATPPDSERDGQPTHLANGDNNSYQADEDLSYLNFLNPTTNQPFPLVADEPIRLRIPVVNNSASKPATLWAFMDWNGDGDFKDEGEKMSQAVATNYNGNIDFDFTIPKIAKSDSIGIRIRLTSGIGIDAYGPAPDGEVEDFVVEILTLDYGDLPDATTGIGNNDYQTLRSRNGARHGIPVVPLVVMGTAVDSEVDGQPSAKSTGDDQNPQVGQDDEDGIVFLTPLVPGYTSQVAFTGRNQSNADAALYVYTDWTNDGVLDLATTYTLAANSTASAQSISLYVPANATFEGGKAFFRFRLTTDPEFNAAPSANGVAIDGEVEDYYVPLFKLGNLVWEDRNNNGFQDAEEIQLGIQNVRVVMRFGGIDPSSANYDEVTQNTIADPSTLTPLGAGVDLIPDYVIDTFTNSKGLYGFTGMIEGNYQIIAVDTFGLTPTRFDWITNGTEEDHDSDGKPLKNSWEYATGERRQSKSQQIKMLESQIGILETGILDQTSSQLLDPNQLDGFPDNKVEHRIDFGYIGLDLGDLAESGNDPSVNNFVTSENGTKPEGPKHIVTPDLRLGKYQDVEWQGQADQDAGEEFLPAADAGGDDPIADFSNYPGSAHDPSQSRHWPFHVADDHDDEDGIKFLSPMVAGYDAVISVKYSAKINLNGPDAYLHAWMDWNGDGNFDDGAGNVDPDEHILFSMLDGKPTILEANTQAVSLEMSYLTSANDSITLTFKVPANAKYNKGNILSRFRISFDPQLGPIGILPANLNFPDPQPGAESSSVPGGIIPYGEVEDYFIALAKVTSTAWQDQNYNGKQDEGEVTFQGQPVKLEFAGLDGVFGTSDDYIYLDTTDINGKFVFCGLIGSNIYDPSGLDTAVYRLIVNVPPNTVPAFGLPTEDACSPLDFANSDGSTANADPGVTQMVFSISNPNGQCATGGTGSGGGDFPETQTNSTINFGFSAFDYGDLPVQGTNYLTLRDSLSAAFNNRFGPRHIIQSRLYLGSGVDGERNGQPDADAGSKNGGDDGVAGRFLKGTGADDETGIRLLTPLIPGEMAYLQVSYTSQDTIPEGGHTNRDAFLRSFIDFNGDGDLNDLSDIVDYSLIAPGMTGPFSPTTNNVQLAGGISQIQVLAFRVPVSATYRNGIAYMRHRLSWNSDPLGPDNNLFHLNTAPFVDTTLTYPQGEVEDYAIPLAKIGNLAWFDHDVFGDQDDNEEVVDSLEMVLVYGGIDPSTGTFDEVGYQRSIQSAGNVADIVYNLSIVPSGNATTAPSGNDSPGHIEKTASSPAQDSGLYSFKGLIPGTYYLIPKKYLLSDSASFTNAWPKHRILTISDNPGVDDQHDNDGMPGALFTLNDGNSKDPEVAIAAQPINETGKQDAADASRMNALMPAYGVFPDSLYNQTIDLGWVDEPNVEAKLDVVGVYFPTSKICGNFNVILHFCVKNPKEVPLDSLQAFLNLKSAYGNALYAGAKLKVSIADSAYINGPAYGKSKKSQAGAKSQLVLNPNYDGDLDTRLLLPTSENANFALKGDSAVCIRIEFEIDPTQTQNYPWMSQGSVTARAVGFNKQTGAKRPLIDNRFFHPRFGKSIILFDNSDSTVQNDECWYKTKWNSGIKDVTVALNSSCESTFSANVFVPNFDQNCGFEKFSEGSFYAVIIQDKWTKETIWTSDDSRPFDAKKYLDRKLTYTVISVANSCAEISGDFFLVDRIAPVVQCATNTDRKVVGNSPTGTYTFVCTDIDSVLNVKRSWSNPNYPYYTGIAVAKDSCGQAWLDNVKDELEVLADCDASANAGFVYARIRRVFTFTDDQDNKTTCTQIISFRRPRIVLPECKVEIPNNLAGASKDLIPSDLLKKPFNLAESVPYYLNGAGKRIYLTGRDYCGIAVNYTDEIVFKTGECGRKIIRHWTLLDWCYGVINNQASYPVYHLVPNADADCYSSIAWDPSLHMLTWEQHLIVGDNGTPIVSIPDYDRDGVKGSGYQGGERDRPEEDKPSTYDAGDVLTISTGPMECKGSYLFTRKDLDIIEQSKWCFDLQVVQRSPILDPFKRPTGSYEWVADPGVSVKGDCDKGYSITGIPMLGNWFLRLRVYDVCYSDTLIYYPIRAVDKIAPVMKSDNKLILSLNNGGLGFVSAEQFDEGSWDNCTRLEWKRLRRPVSNLVNANFIGIKGVVDANENGKIDAYSSSTTSPQDYVDVNRNRQADPEEYFKIDANTSLLMTPLMDSVPFFCADRGSVMLELWGNDIAGNRSYSWGNVLIEDKTIPVCSAPWTISVSCDDKSLYFIDSKVASAKAFGDVLITTGNLCADFDTAYSVVKKLKCGAGTIERIWTLTKQTSKGSVVVTCKQIIKVLPLREYNICFPKDADQRDCKTPVIDTAFIKELGCDILAVNVTDKHYDASNDECYKIFRTYTVIDWCAYDDNCGDPTADGIVYEVDRSYSNYGQTPIYVLVRDADQDQREEFYLSLNDTPKEGNLSDSKVGTGNDEAFVPAYCENAFSDNPYGLPVGEFYHAFQYTQIIKVYDEVKPVVTGTQAKFCIRDGGDCLADIKMIVKGTDNCTDQVTLETNLLAIAPFQTREAGNMIGYSTSRWSTKVLAGGQFEINVSNLPQGKHDLIVVVRDECGNLSEPTRIPFTVEDCKGPAPICINGLSTSLMPDGSGGGLITVWATDFVASKVFDCNGQGPETSGNGKLVTKYSINRVGSPASENQTSMVFNCKEAGKIVLVELHAWDNAGNHDFCVSFVEVQDNRKVCETGNANLGSIIGVVTTDQFVPLPGVAIDMNGASALKQTTANSGVFAFTGLSKGADFSLSAQLDKDHINGVSTFDLVVIQKHILGVKLIDNPYRQIAADVNNSKSITTLDMIQIRKLILQVDDKFKSVPSWKFVDASYKFPNASNPFGAEYPEVINVNNLNGNVKADFVAIKMGDVNGNASTVNGIAAAEIRSNRHLLLIAEEQTMKVDGSYEVAIRAKDLQNIQGYQFTLTYAQNLVELEGIDYGVAKADNFGIFKNKGAITTSWNPNSGVSAASNEVLFTLKLKAKANTKLSEVIKLSSHLTPAEAYDKENESIGIRLSFGAITSQDFTVLRQNKPNPFSDETSIGFYLPKATKGILSIRDSKGSLIYRVDGTYSKGENKIVLKQAELRASGVLYYTLETADFVDTKKMILLNP